MKLRVVPKLESSAQARPRDNQRAVISLVQTRWHADPTEHLDVLRRGVRTAAAAGAGIVFLQELTLSRYFADEHPAGTPAELAEPLVDGPTHKAAHDLASAADILVHASLFERADRSDGLGFNTAIVVAPDGTIISRTRKMHIPRTAGYYEHEYFRDGDADGDPYPVISAPVTGTTLKFGVPTCYDQWFPEVAREYSLGGAHLIAYATARIRTRPSRFRHDAVVAQRDNWASHRQWYVHGGREPVRQRRKEHLLR